MAVDTVWDEEDPADSKNPKLGAGDIRDTKIAVRQRVAMGHYLLGSGTDANDGKHVCGGGTADSTGNFTIFEADKTTAAALLSDSTGTNADTLKLGDGRAGGANGYTLDTETVNAKDIDATGTLDVAGKSTFAGEVQRDDKLTVTVKTLTEANDGYTLADEEIAVVTPGAAMTVNLPAAAGVTGRIYTVVVSSNASLGATYALTLDPDSGAGETIGGETTWILGQGDSIRVQSDGSDWQVLSSYRASQTALYTQSASDEIVFTESLQEINSIASVYVPLGGASYVLCEWSGSLILLTSSAGSVEVTMTVRRDTTTIATFSKIVTHDDLTAQTYRVAFQFLDTGATPGTSYDYNVMAKIEDDGSPPSAVYFAKTSDQNARIITALVQRQSQ